MRNLLLSVALVGLPVVVFSAGHAVILPHVQEAANVNPPQSGPPLGDMSAFIAIIADTRTAISSGDVGAAQKRITDFETAWDGSEASLRPMDPADWGNVDTVADAAPHALRAEAPDPAKIAMALADLQAELADPRRSPSVGGVFASERTVSGVAITDPVERDRAPQCRR